MMDSSLTTRTGLREFFYNKVKEALSTQKITISEEVEYYIVNVLTHFARAENLFERDKEGHLEFKPLALRLYDAVFDVPDKKFQHLKVLGDTALYHAGVFYDAIFQDVVDVDYYINMGGSAYQSLANMTTTHQVSISEMFLELSNQFQSLIEIMYLSCEKEIVNSNHDILKLLERYKKTGSVKAKELLMQKGLNPDLILADKIVQ